MPENAQDNTVLVVEDDEYIVSILKILLEREGYNIITAADGQVAYDQINELPPPKLVLLDIMLPYIDGYDLMKVIRNKTSWEKVPIIVLSSKQLENDIVQALEAGVNDYIVKPFQPMELLARIKRYL